MSAWMGMENRAKRSRKPREIPARCVHVLTPKSSLGLIVQSMASSVTPDPGECQSCRWGCCSEALLNGCQLQTGDGNEEGDRPWGAEKRASYDVKSDRDSKSVAPEASCGGLVPCESMCSGLCHSVAARGCKLLCFFAGATHLCVT